MAAGLVGCQTGGRSDAGPTASAMQYPILENVPLPRGMRLVDDRSVGLVSGTLRVGKFEFRGDVGREAAAKFYREYMPSQGWTLRTEDFDRGTHTIRFDSSTEECTIRLRQEGRQTSVQVHLIPLPRGSAEREIRPPVRR